jgi:NhaA family Na+:H+ antiporter
MSPRDLITAGMIAGTGFTVALFVAGEAFTDPLITGAAKMGAMMSLSAAVCGLLLGVVLRIKKQC